MSKVKFYIEKIKSKFANVNLIKKVVLWLAAILCVVAIGCVLFVKPIQKSVFNPESHLVIEVQKGDTLSKILGEQGFTSAEIDVIAKTLKKSANFSTIRPGVNRFDFVRPTEESPVSKIVIDNGPWNRVELNCGEEVGTWNCEQIEIERDVRVVYKGGEILEGDSFYLAGQRAGIPDGILMDVYDLLAFEMDFERDIRSGQRFGVLYEENYNSEKKVDNGHIMAVSFEALRGTVKMYRFKKADGQIGYYDEVGNGAIKSLKRTPINNAKITSNFAKRRKHPVLGFTRAHKGVDFRASTGTPIPAAGAGRVIARGYNRGHGNFVKIRHNGSYETLYGHMSRFVKNVRVGTTVKQGQTIGYVGSTGLSTGPHLHYEIIKNGQHVNPMTVKLPAINNLAAADKKVFSGYRDYLDSVIGDLEQNPTKIVRLSEYAPVPPEERAK